MTDPTSEPTAVEERVARHLAARDWLTDEDRWTNSTAAFRADYLTAAREVIALVQAPAAVPVSSPPADRAAVLTAAERQFLTFALDLAFDRMVSDDGFTDEDKAALKSLRRMADETPAALDLAAADSPTPLRWGLDDVMYGDDDTTTVMLSGPSGEPYWLELEPERAAALRDSLTGPGEPAAEPGEELASGVQQCGHDDYHDPHEWHDKPHLWCPGHSTATDEAPQDGARP